MFRRTFHPIFKEGASESILPFTAEAGQLKAKAFGPYSQLHSENLNSPPAVFLDIDFLHTSPGKFLPVQAPSGRGLWHPLEMYSFYAGRSFGSPCEINRPDALECGAVLLPANLPGQRSRAVLAFPVPEVPGHGFLSLAVSREA